METSTSARNHLQQLYQRQRLLQIGVFSLVTILIWVGFSLLRSQRKTKISAELRDLAKPLTPTINVDVVSQIERDRAFTDDELAEFPIYKIIVTEEGAPSRVVTIDTDVADVVEEESSSSRLGTQLQTETAPSQSASPSADEF